MSDVEIVEELQNGTNDDTNQTCPYYQLMAILRKKIRWNQIFSEATTMEGELWRKFRIFTEKQKEYMELMNILLDSILSGYLKVYFPQFTEIQDKYKVLEENVSNFKMKLIQANQEVQKGRMEWADGLLTNQVNFLTKFSAEEREAILNKCREGDRVAVKLKLMVNDLKRKWSVLEPDMENRLKMCIQEVKDCLGTTLI